MSETENAGLVSESELKDRAIRLFTFLREVTALRTKTVRTLDSYEQVIWMADSVQRQITMEKKGTG